MPTYWRDDQNFLKLLQEIKCFGKNVFIDRDMISICKKINCKETCDQKCSSCQHHPFSFLYKFNMLGYICVSALPHDMVTQTFICGNEISFWEEKHDLEIRDDILYFLHPSLTKAIEEKLPLKGRKIKHFNGFILGEGLQIRSELVEQIIHDIKKGTDDLLFGPKKY